MKQELERVKSAMVQVKTIQDKDKRQRVNVQVAERFISSAIWNPGEPKKRKSGQDDSEVKTKKAKWLFVSKKCLRLSRDVGMMKMEQCIFFRASCWSKTFQ